IDSIDLREVAILVTADHATPPSIRAHTDDPVPLLLVGGRIKPDEVLRLEEKTCYELGSIGVLNHGWEILPKILDMIRT
ncbi:MAG: hypothetical protein QXQ31_05425, partial [Zestosphaera sp.]